MSCSELTGRRSDMAAEPTQVVECQITAPEHAADFRSTVRSFVDMAVGTHLGDLMESQDAIRLVVTDISGTQEVSLVGQRDAGLVDSLTTQIGRCPDTTISAIIELGRLGQMSIEWDYRIDQGAPRSVRFGIAVRVTTPIAGPVAERFLVQLKKILASSEVVGGFVNIDSIRNPYHSVAIRDSAMPRADPRTQVEGYYWAMLLNRQHCLALDHAGVELDSVFESVEQFGSGDSWVRVGLSVLEPADWQFEHAAALRDQIAVLLAPGFPVFFEDIGVKGTELYRPVKLAEGVPVPRIVRHAICSNIDIAASPLALSVTPTSVADAAMSVHFSDASPDPEWWCVVAAALRAWWIAVGFGQGATPGFRWWPCIDINLDSRNISLSGPPGNLASKTDDELSESLGRVLGALCLQARTVSGDWWPDESVELSIPEVAQTC